MNSQPPCRRLRAYTYDPSLATQLDTALINETVLRIPWEEDLLPGPIGEYLEVVDYDPSSECFYDPVNLNDSYLLAQDGLAPSEGNPHFHQQMVYAVAMTTIHNFEAALGRKALWAPHFARDAQGRLIRDEKTKQPIATAVQKLRVYPHALREANAYYSPDKKALLFGYFPAILANPGENLPGGLVFTCLSHDVVAHETTHALLDGLHRYFDESSNPDVLAFHEGFADLVALFQHFTQPEALRHQIAKTRGDLGNQNLLGELAHQFGQAIGNHGALRDAIGKPDPKTGEWKPQEPNPEDYPETTEPHDRGAILVAAMFDAFVSIYKARTADLLRIATGGSGVLPTGHIHPDLVNRLADEAAKVAGHFLRIVIRALDYCPPMDITFGEYLRAMITADYDLMPEDDWGYRIAIIEAFRRRGIYPRDVRTLAADALRWNAPEDLNDIVLPDPDGGHGPGTTVTPDQACGVFADLIFRLKAGLMPDGSRPIMPDGSQSPVAALPTLEWQTTGDRATIDERNHQSRYITWAWFKNWLYGPGGKEPRDSAMTECLGLALGVDVAPTIYRGADGLPSIEIHSIRSSRRPLQNGQTRIDLVIEMTQRRRGYLSVQKQKEADTPPYDHGRFESDAFRPDFTFRGGCTLLVDGENGTVRHCIVKSVGSDTRLGRQREFVRGSSEPSLRATYSRPTPGAPVKEPFAMLHRGH